MNMTMHMTTMHAMDIQYVCTDIEQYYCNYALWSTICKMNCQAKQLSYDTVMCMYITTKGYSNVCSTI